MTTKLWNNVWVAQEKTGQAYYVANYNCNHGVEMSLEKYGEDEIGVYIGSKDGYVEIPPKPDEEALKRQGYRLTGMAADCSKPCDNRLYVNTDGLTVCNGHFARADGNTWRWLVERIDTEASEQRAQQRETDFGTTTDEGDGYSEWRWITGIKDDLIKKHIRQLIKDNQRLVARVDELAMKLNKLEGANHE